MQRSAAGQLLRVAATLAVMLLSGCREETGFPAGFDPAGSDPHAIEVARRTIAASGGMKGWSETRYLAFDFVYEVGEAAPIAYRHHWDLGTGAYRVEGMLDEEQTPYIVIFNVNTREGNAWIAGQPAGGDDLAQLLEDAYGRFINDSYWLIMPLKLLDPGVHLHDEGEVSSETGMRDRIRVSFDSKIGLTPGDVYWVEVDRESGRMVRWEFVLEGDEDKYGYSWTEWGKFGPLNLSTVKEYDDGSERILLLNVIASRDLDPEPFKPPDGAQASDPI